MRQTGQTGASQNIRQKDWKQVTADMGLHCMLKESKDLSEINMVKSSMLYSVNSVRVRYFKLCTTFAEEWTLFFNVFVYPIGRYRKRNIKTRMKSRTISLKKLRTLPILQQIQMNLQNQSQVIQRILFGYPQVEKLTLLRAPEPTPQRRKVNCFQQNTSISWWPRFGTKLIRRSRQLFLITRRVRRPLSRLTWKTVRRRGILKQMTKAMVKRKLIHCRYHSLIYRTGAALPSY